MREEPGGRAMASTFLSSIQSQTAQVWGFVRGWAASPPSASDPRSSVLEDLKKLERTLKRIQTVLHDAEEREIREESVKLWLKELRQVAYDAEDVLDEYHYEGLRAQVEARASSKRKRSLEGDDDEEVSGSLSTTVSIPYGMGDRIRDVRESLDEISLDLQRLHLRVEDGERRASGAAYPSPTSHMVDESIIYGREHDKNKIIDLLLSKEIGNGVSVIPIVGKGGLGKTTIAQLVYNDSKVKQCFNLTGWVCVSDDFNITRLTKDIIESITKKPCLHTQLSTLQHALNETVKRKRVLLVLDDVWNQQPSLWENLIFPFVGAETVAIIVTCRNDEVAEIMQTVDPHRPGYLSLEQSWSLFSHYAFGGGVSEEQSIFVDIGRQIVKKCSGLPLAVKTIGSLLRHTADEDSWMDVLKSDLWEADENNETLAALRLSYSRMPAHLKPCFVYCSMFPNDYLFDKDALVRLWMAQGYIIPQGKRRLEDIGDEYFNDLRRRSFFDSYDAVFKMHDIMHDLAKSIAGNEFCTMVDEKLGYFPHEVRHLYLGTQESLVKSLSSYHTRALRTLFMVDPSRRAGLRKLPIMTGCLRTLHFDWASAGELPGSIGNLKHLRYLHIQSEAVQSLPESVCILYHLQTLILDCGGLEELLDGLGNLINLRYLKVKTSIHFKPPCLPAWIPKLTNLRKLQGRFEVRNGKEQSGMGVLKDLDLQGSLCITGLRNLVRIEDARDASLKSKHRLEQLFLKWDCKSYHWKDVDLHLNVSREEKQDNSADDTMEEAMLQYLQPHANLKTLYIQGYEGSKFPKWVGDTFSLASFQEMTIIQCKNISFLPICIHDSLGKDRALDIYDCPQLRILSEDGLPAKLHLFKILNIHNCPQLQLQLLLEDGPPSKLEKLCIHNNQQFTSLSRMQNLHLLKTLTIWNCPKFKLISEEQLPLNLEELRIAKCQQLTSLLGLHNLHSLKVLDICSCPQLQILAEDGLPSKLEQVWVENCQELTSLWGLHNLHLLKKLGISCCPQLRLVSDEGLPSELVELCINECKQLELLSGLQNLASLNYLYIKRCPRLRIMAEDQLSSLSCILLIIDCPRLVDWCQIQKFNCIQVALGSKVIVSNNWENIKHGSDDFTSLEHLQSINCFEFSTGTYETQQPRSWLFVSNSWVPFGQIGCRYEVEQLTIWSCMCIPPNEYLPELASLQRLIIKDCPEIRLVPHELLPSTLKSLIIHGCKKLMNLQLTQENRDELKELQIVNCPNLTMVEGLSCLFSLNILRIKQCPKLWLSRGDWLPFVPPCIEIAGVLQNEFYPPHSEEAENKEAIDDGRQRSQS